MTPEREIDGLDDLRTLPVGSRVRAGCTTHEERHGFLWLQKREVETPCVWERNAQGWCRFLDYNTQDSHYLFSLGDVTILFVPEAPVTTIEQATASAMRALRDAEAVSPPRD